MTALATLPSRQSPAEVALSRYDFTWERLVKLANKALNDHLAHRRQFLDDERRKRVLDYLVDVGLEWAHRYDEAKAGGRSFASSAYQRMYIRVPDPLRQISGDPRRGTPLVEVATDMVSERGQLDEESFEQLVENVAGGLQPRALRTLNTVARDMLVFGHERWFIAQERGIEPAMITDLLEELGWQLRRTLAA